MDIPKLNEELKKLKEEDCMLKGKTQVIVYII